MNFTTTVNNSASEVDEMDEQEVNDTKEKIDTERYKEPQVSKATKSVILGISG